MLTKKQNLLETIRGGNPDRYVNQYEAIAMVYGTPYSAGNPMPVMGGPESIYPGVYETISEEIAKVSDRIFK